MINIRDFLPERLKQLFGRETQESIGKKLGVKQATVSKWLSGEMIPPTETLLLIAEAYNVSVDWLLGLSGLRSIDGVNYEKITYEQAIRVLDHMIERGTITHPDMNSFAVKKKGKEPRYDSDYLKVNDLALSHMLRRRMKVIALEDDYYALWKGKLDIFEGITLLKYDHKMQEAIETKAWFKFDDADWKRALSEFEAMTEEELEAYIEKSKEDQQNG